MRDDNLFGTKLTARQVAMKKLRHLVSTDRDPYRVISDAIDEGVKIGKADAAREVVDYINDIASSGTLEEIEAAVARHRDGIGAAILREIATVEFTQALELFQATTTAVTRGGRENVVAVIYLFDNDDADHANHIINSSIVAFSAIDHCSAYRVVDAGGEMG